MTTALHQDAAVRSGFAPWRLGLWLILLPAAFGCLQYSVHAQRVWTVLNTAAPLDPSARTALHAMLAWDVGYFVAAAALVVCCGGGILRQGWARPVLRGALSLLALGLVASAATLYRQWQVWNGEHTAGNGVTALVAQEWRRVHLALGIEVVAVLVLIWLVWQLGREAVRRQFRTRRA